MLQAAEAGAGITMVDRFIAQDALASGALVRVLAEHAATPGFPLHALYSGRRWVPRKVRVFLDAMRRRIAAEGEVVGLRPP